MTRRALLLINRKARRGQENLVAIAERLAAGGLDLFEGQSSLTGDAAEIIRTDGPRADVIILGGGDGTLHQALPALLEVQKPIGIIPLGTANDLARTLGLPTDPLAACDVILTGQLKAIDVGFVNDRPFLNAASIGLAVDVTRRLTRSAKSRWGILAYLWAAIGALWRGRRFAVEFDSDGNQLCTRTWQVTVGNGRSYGGGLSVHESARIDDGQLDLYSLETVKGWHLLGLIPALWRGSLDPVPTVRTLRSPHFSVRPVKRPRPITADGELAGTTPATFHVRPQALAVYVPSDD
jgi:YegS/Rv2252/BmrU family lipid kinase